MKQTNLSVFYQLGKGIKDIEKLETNMPVSQAMFTLFEPLAWLSNFIEETEGLEMPDSRAAAKYTMESIEKIGDFKNFSAPDPARPLTGVEVTVILGRRDWFEKCFDREYRAIDVFTVTAKGIYDTRRLMTKPEDKFPDRIRKVLPVQTMMDLKEAAKCLAFEIPTACAFHVCRATEALMLYYYEVLTGHQWPLPKNRDWKAYIDHLIKEGSPASITTRLDEIRNMDRNAYAHPDRNVTLEESPIQFELCTNVMFQMGLQIDKKLNP